MPVAVADCWGDTNPQNIFTYLMGSISGTRKLWTWLWDIADCIWKYTVNMLGLWVGCEASDQSFCQAEGVIYNNFVYSGDAFCHWNFPPPKKAEGVNAGSIARVLSRTFPTFLSEWQNLLLLVYFTAGSLSAMCVCKLPLETLGKLRFWAWDPVS